MVTPEQAAKLKRRGWRSYNDGTTWESPKRDGVRTVIIVTRGKSGVEFFVTGIHEDMTDGIVHGISFPGPGDGFAALEFAAITGMAPPGYRLVPDSVVRDAAWLLCKMSEADVPTHWDRTRAPEVAAALRGESTDLSPASGR